MITTTVILKLVVAIGAGVALGHAIWALACAFARRVHELLA